jgi:hypothetical protein
MRCGDEQRTGGHDGEEDPRRAPPVLWGCSDLLWGAPITPPNANERPSLLRVAWQMTSGMETGAPCEMLGNLVLVATMRFERIAPFKRHCRERYRTRQQFAVLDETVRIHRRSHHPVLCSIDPPDARGWAVLRYRGSSPSTTIYNSTPGPLSTSLP